MRVLDPACGSGNFLYVALAGLLDLEKEVVAYGAANGLPAMLPRVGPAQLAGLEINEYARELAQVVVWIGYLQWMTAQRLPVNRDPVLEPLQTIRLQDALLDRSDPEHPKEAVWPAADFIIGNPPFLGGKGIAVQNLGDDYVEATLRDLRPTVLPGCADLVCYFFEKAREQIALRRAQPRSGLLATNSHPWWRESPCCSIGSRRAATSSWPGPTNRGCSTARPSASRSSALTTGRERTRCLNGQPVVTINADLTALIDLSGDAIVGKPRCQLHG